MGYSNFLGTGIDCPDKSTYKLGQNESNLHILLFPRGGTIWSSPGIFTIVSLEILKISNGSLAPFLRMVGVSLTSHKRYSEMIWSSILATQTGRDNGSNVERPPCLAHHQTGWFVPMGQSNQVREGWFRIRKRANVGQYRINKLPRSSPFQARIWISGPRFGQSTLVNLYAGQNGTARYIVTDFLENFRISKYLKLHA